ncbi:hypothetical protein ACI2KT_30700 [Ensifer adhaerens]|uniref:hypothetical protein n=1 Tax=Ensifer adhaerens TaxID=106592 RepID=UPI00384FDBA2
MNFLRFWQVLNIVLILGSCAVLANCTTLVTEELRETASGTNCDLGNGGYALPKDILRVRVALRQGDPASYEIGNVDVIRTADNETYCLNHLSSALSNDRIEIIYGQTEETKSLLSSISTTFSDQSLAIASSFVDAAAAVAARPRGAFVSDAGLSFVGEFDFDPFDYDRTRKANLSLSAFDHCVFLDPSNDPYVPAWHANLCPVQVSKHTAPAVVHAIPLKDSRASVGDYNRPGVLYRPALTHKLIVMKRDHDAGGAWRVFQTRRVQMTTAAPVLALEVKRSLFVSRDMDITFAGGVLTSVKINKPSEAAAVSAFVLRTAQVIVSIPVRALIIGTTDRRNREELIRAQAALIKTMQDYDKAVKDAKAAKIAARAGQQPQSQRTAFDPVGEAVASAEGDFNECVNAASMMDSPYEECAKLLEAGAGSQ